MTKKKLIEHNKRLRRANGILVCGMISLMLVVVVGLATCVGF